MTLEAIIGLGILIFLFLYIAFGLSQEHIAIKTLLILLSLWFILGLSAVLRAYVEADLSTPSGVAEIYNFFFYAIGLACVMITLYAIFYLFYSVYNSITKK